MTRFTRYIVTHILPKNFIDIDRQANMQTVSTLAGLNLRLPSAPSFVHLRGVWEQGYALMTALHGARFLRLIVLLLTAVFGSRDLVACTLEV